MADVREGWGETSRRMTAACLSDVVAALPDAPLIRAWDISQATGLSVQIVNNLREQGAFTALNLGSAERPRYRYRRASFLQWLESRILPGEY